MSTESMLRVDEYAVFRAPGRSLWRAQRTARRDDRTVEILLHCAGEHAAFGLVGEFVRSRPGGNRRQLRRRVRSYSWRRHRGDGDFCSACVETWGAGPGPFRPVWQYPGR